MSDVKESKGSESEADSDDDPGIESAGQDAGNGHHECQGYAAGREGHPRLLRGVAKIALQELRQQDRAAIEHHAENKAEGDSGGKVSLAEQAQVHDRVIVREFAEDQRRQRDDGNDRADENHLGGEPIVLLAFVEHILQEANADNDQADADIVHADTGADVLQVRRIMHDALREHEREDADRHVDQEYPMPAVVVGEPPAERWTDSGRDHDCHSIHGKGHAALLG
jgi:hypothetical protein